MNAVDTITKILAYVGAINWGLIGALDFNLVTAIFGLTPMTTVVYVLVGLSGLYQLVLLIRILTANRTTSL